MMTMGLTTDWTQKFCGLTIHYFVNDIIFTFSLVEQYTNQHEKIAGAQP